MKKVILCKKTLVCIMIVLLAVLTCFFVIGIVNKDANNVVGILKDYVSIDNDSLSDWFNHTFQLAVYRTDENKNKILSIGFSTHTDLSDVLPYLAEMRNRINEYVNSSHLSKEISDVSFSISNGAKWVLRMWTVSDKIVVGFDESYSPKANDLTYNTVLKACDNFEDINIGGYKGGSVSVTEMIDKDFFVSFTNLKHLKISHIRTQKMVEQLKSATSNLSEKGVIVEIEQY